MQRDFHQGLLSMTDDRRTGKKRRAQVARRQGEQRVRPIPVAIERRDSRDRRSLVDRRSGVDRRDDEDRHGASKNRA
jgi:hypothetical protein